MELEREGPTPLYRQVARALQAHVDERLSAGDRLPSTADLATQFGVNRLTVRQAIGELVAAGRLRTRRGAGTFVADAPAFFEVHTDEVEGDLRIGSLHDSVLADGQQFVEQLIGTGEARDAPVGLHLDAAGIPLRWVTTVTTVQGEPWLTSTYWARPPVLAGIEDPWPTGSRFLDVVRDRNGLHLRRRWRAFSAAAADLDDARVLGVDVGRPLLVRSGLDVDDAGHPAVYVDRRCRSDRLRFVLRHDA